MKANASHRVRYADARELTAEQAVERVFNNLSPSDENIEWLNCIASEIDMTATIHNGKVRVRRAKR